MEIYFVCFLQSQSLWLPVLQLKGHKMLFSDWAWREMQVGAAKWWLLLLSHVVAFLAQFL